MTKKRLVNKVAGVLAGTALGLLPLVSNAQDYSKIQKGVNAPTYVGETSTHKIYHFNFNKDLQRAITSSKNPSIYLTGDNYSYVLFDPDTTGYNLYYFKKNLNEFGEGKELGLNIKGDKHANPCDNKGLGSKTNYLVSFYWAPQHTKTLEQPKQIPELPKEVKEQPEEKQSKPCNIIIDNTSNVTNNYYTDTTNKRLEKSKGEGLELRLLTEANKNVNSLESPFFGASAALQLGKGAVWVGPYVTAGFGKDSYSNLTPIYHETLLNQAIQLSTVTEGIRREKSELSYPIEFGGLLSVGSKDGRVRVNLGYGTVKEKTSTSNVTETGQDWIAQNGEVVGEKKPYSIELQKGQNSDKYIPTQKVGVDVHPFKESGFYFGAEAQHRGKINSKMDNINYNIKAGWRFGGKRK